MQLLLQICAVLLISLTCTACAKQVLGALAAIYTTRNIEACHWAMETSQRHALQLVLTDQLVC